MTMSWKTWIDCDGVVAVNEDMQWSLMRCILAFLVCFFFTLFLLAMDHSALTMDLICFFYFVFSCHGS